MRSDRRARCGARHARGFASERVFSLMGDEIIENGHIMARKTGSHADITGPKVRQAALRLFAQHGFAAVSMRQIARDVGVQAGALYSYTPDKQSLLFDLMRGHMDDLLAARAQESVAGSSLKQLDDFTAFHIRFHLDRCDAVFLSYMELRNLSAENFTEVARLRGLYEAQLEDILQRGVAAGVFELHDCKITVMAIIAMLTGLTTWYQDGGRLPRGDVEAIYIRLVRGAVGVS